MIEHYYEDENFLIAIEHRGDQPYPHIHIKNFNRQCYEEILACVYDMTEDFPNLKAYTPVEDKVAERFVSRLGFVLNGNIIQGAGDLGPCKEYSCLR